MKSIRSVHHTAAKWGVAYYMKGTLAKAQARHFAANGTS